MPADRQRLGTRVAAWCAADDPDLRCGSGPLARYLYVARLAVRGFARLGRLALRR